LPVSSNSVLKERFRGLESKNDAVGVIDGSNTPILHHSNL
jgi:hypothetical protein